MVKIAVNPSETPDQTQDEMDEEKAIQKIIAETDDDLTVKVYRMDDKAVNGKIFLGDIPAEAFSLQAISTKYGGGVFLLHVLNKLGNFATRKKVQIGGLPKEELKEELKMDNGNSDILKMMQMQLEAAQTRNDTLMQAIITGLNKDATPVAPANSLTDMLAMFSTFQNMIPKQETTPQTSFENMLALVKMGKEMAGNGAETNELDILSESLKTFFPIIKDAIKNEPKPMRQISQGQEQMDIGQIKAAVEHLLQLKESGIDPKAASEYIKEKIPTMFLNKIMGMLRRSDWEVIVLRYSPQAQSGLEWLKEFRNALLGLTSMKKADIVSDTGPSTVTGINDATAHQIPITPSRDT